ncbi:SCO family protein [Piscinibacter terrae]|uniref:Cytochrome oxidase Cu insertion factor, SCO1/SenC/PrrC family n=1 Tax=Piscinibacter terrae TaxID=2496871 RepID=A0A3N7HHQ3_9BURK|nr:hypothetical protein [Albitalea terrae]RQP21577.1 hypothetical protein DZC73_27090 [Albitalea terrae]
MSEPAKAAPEPVSFTVHSLPTPGIDGDAVRRTASGRLKMLLVLAVCAAPVVASYVTYFVIRPQGRTNYADLITPVREIPASLPLKTLAGEDVKAQSLHGQWLFVVVADAACDALCEKQLYLQRQLRETLGRDKDRMDKVWLIPDAGTPRKEVMDAISAVDKPTVLRVPREELSKWLAPADGHRLEEHVYLVDPMGQWMMRAPANAEPTKLKRDLERLLRASSSWDQPGR